MKPCCLYCLSFPNGKEYIGIATNFHARMKSHRIAAETGKGYAVHRAIAKFGWDRTKRTVLCIGTQEFIKDLEVKAISAFGSRSPGGYNLTDGGDGTSGRETPAEMRRAISERMKGNSITKGIKRDPSTIRKGWKHTEETKKKISAGNTGKVVSEETRSKIRESAAGREPWSNERRAAHSKMLLGNTRKKGVPISNDQKRQHKEFFERVRCFMVCSGFKGQAKSVNKSMLESHCGGCCGYSQRKHAFAK